MFCPTRAHFARFASYPIQINNICIIRFFKFLYVIKNEVKNFTYAPCTNRVFLIYHLKCKSEFGEIQSNYLVLKSVWRVVVWGCLPLDNLQIHSCLASQGCGMTVLVRSLNTAQSLLSSSSFLSSIKDVTTCTKTDTKWNHNGHNIWILV